LLTSASATDPTQPDEGETSWVVISRETGSGYNVAGHQTRRPLAMIRHAVYPDREAGIQSRAARSRDLAIHMACELLQRSYKVRRAIGPDGAIIERAELEAHFDEGRFPGLRRATQPLR